MTSIKRRIMFVIIAVVIVLGITLSTIGVLTSQSSAIDTLKKAMTAAAKIGANQVAVELEKIQSIAFEIGCNSALSNVSSTDQVKQEILDEKVKTYGYTDSAYINSDGIAVKNGNVLSDMVAVKTAMAGSTYVSEPVQQGDSSYTIVVTAPIWKEGHYNTTVVGVVMLTLDNDFLNEIMRTIDIGSTGEAYMINSEGTVIAYIDNSYVEQKVNTISDAKTDSSLNAIAAFESDLIAGNAGASTYTWNGAAKIAGYSPVNGTSGWGLAITARQSEYTQMVVTGFITSVACTVAAIIIGVIIALRFSKSVSKPIVDCGKRLSLLAKGDLHTEIPTTKAKDETGALLKDLEIVTNILSLAIKDTEQHLQNIVAGDFTQAVTLELDGDFKSLTESLRIILDRLNENFGQIHTVASQVASGADQVASGAQSLAQGATEQAASIEELSSSLESISKSVSETAELTKRADSLSENMSKEVENSNNQMDGMIAAMGDISSSSEQIGRIIKTIEDIAFQTNILALNAAVEAARAGEAGKGFAVVADEVRNLASKSADAAKNTNDLIGGSMQAVENGVKIADETYKSLTRVVEGSREVTKIVRQITQATEFETEAIMQTTQGIDQISNVVQVTSATAEESAAASEELSGQAAQLRSQLEVMKLRDEHYQV